MGLRLAGTLTGGTGSQWGRSQCYVILNEGDSPVFKMINAVLKPSYAKCNLWASSTGGTEPALYSATTYTQMVCMHTEA